MKTKLLALLLLIGQISSLYALDLGKALEETVKQKLEDSKTNTESNPTVSNPTKTPENTLSEINWKKPSQEEEMAIGRQVTGHLLGAAPLVNDSGLQQYVNKVGRWIAMQSERPDLPWKFGVIDTSDINAFAAPGGYVLITKGLYLKLQNEAQLAGVLGHEIAHIIKKHHLKVMQKQALISAGASLLGEKLGDNALSKRAIGTGAEMSARNLDKAAEYEADHMGMILAARAGYDVYGLAEVLTILDSMDQKNDQVTLLFKTHPLPNDRLTQLGQRAGSQLDTLPAGKTLEKRLHKIN